jgi:hypothetical protein
MPPMLRSILCAALGKLPNAVIENMDVSGETADKTAYLAAITRKIEEAKIDLVAVLDSEEFRLSDFSNLLKRFRKPKILVIYQDGRHGCLYKLDIFQTQIEDLALSSIYDALNREETGNGANGASDER